MNNFFLLNESIKTTTIEEFEIGINNINKINQSRVKDSDNFMIHEEFWNYKTVNGFVYEFAYDIINKELQILLPKLFGTFTTISDYFSNEADFDNKFPNECNGFLGINFLNLGISNIRQIVDELSFTTFKNQCNANLSFQDVNEFWNIKENIFPNIVFCENVFEQINHLSINDDRFKLIFEKLKVLNRFINSWKEGNFEYKKLGLDNSPDTPSRIKNTQELRTFNCPNIGFKIFSLHIKWYFGREPFRMYYYPSVENKKVYIGYVGPKDDIGF